MEKFIFFVTAAIWSFHFRSSSTHTPTSLRPFYFPFFQACWRHSLPIFTSFSLSCQVHLMQVWILNILSLKGSDWVYSERTICLYFILSTASRMFCPLQSTIVSSANLVKIAVSSELLTALMYMRNIIGPNIDPCGPPSSTVHPIWCDSF